MVVLRESGAAGRRQQAFDELIGAVYQKKSWITSTTWPVSMFTSSASSQ